MFKTTNICDMTINFVDMIYCVNFLATNKCFGTLELTL